MLFCSGCAILWLQLQSLELKLKYPPKDCLSTDTGFFYTEYKASSGKGKDEADKERMEKIYADAIQEVKQAYQHSARGLTEGHPGYL